MKGIPTAWTGLAAAIPVSLLMAIRVIVDFALGGWSSLHWTHLCWSVLIGGLLAIVLSHAIWMAVASGRRVFPEASIPGPAVWWLWVGILLIAVLLLPAAFEPDQYSLASLFVFGGLLAFPAAWADGRRLAKSSSPVRGQIVEVGYRVLPHALLLVALISSLVYLNTAWRSIGSVDFFYYICGARDMLMPDVTVSDHCYSYFPGVYAFWRAVMRFVGAALPQLQWSYALVLALNASLIAVIVGRVTRSLLASCFTVVWYLVLISRFEGFSGVSEPLATVVLLSGVLLWGGQPLRGFRGTTLAVLFGVAIGLTVYTKQQAGLLTLGCLSLLVLRHSMAHDRQHGWGQLALLPVVAIVTLLTGILLEGRGWIPLTKGLSLASGYGTEGSLLRNLYTQIRGDESAALAAGLMVFTWCGILWKGNHRRWADASGFQIASFAVLAFLFALVQFVSRPFGHYMLLAIPWLVIGSVLLAHALWRHLPERLTRSLLVRNLLLAAVALLFFNTSGRTNTLYAWRWHLPSDMRVNKLWHEQPTRAQDIAAAQTVVIPGSEMYIVPSRHNSIYYLLQTHTANPDGYTYLDADLEAFPWHDCRYFILLTRGLDEYDYQFCSPARVQEVRRMVQGQGYHLRDDANLRTMELYERAGE